MESRNVVIARPAESVNPIDRDAGPTLVFAIEKLLLDLILSGGAPAGRKLNENELARKWGVSRTALREAVRRLEQAGLVTIIQNRGVFVRRIGLGEALGLFDVHAGLARTAGRLLCNHITASQLTELETLHLEMVVAKDNFESEKYYVINAQFHDMLMKYTRNIRLIAFHEMISNGLQTFRLHNLQSGGQIEASVREHGKIIDALKERNPEKAAQAFEQHVLAGKQRMLDAIPADSLTVDTEGN
jgi:DNA-binding GntR family transcriptional regulator